MDALSLIFDDDAQLVQTQGAPIPRPDPIQRPGSEPPMRARPKPQPRRMLSPDEATGLVFDDEPEPPTQAAPPPPRTQQGQPSFAEPDAPSWIGRRVQDVMGKKDTRYQGLPTIAEVLNKEGKLTPGTGLGSEAWGWLVGAEDKDMAKVYGGILGDRLIRTESDANGYPVVVYRDQGGKEAKAYVNAPGLDMQDVVRGTVGVAPYLGVAGAVGRGVQGANLVARTGAQGLAMGGTSVAQDVAGAASGVTEFDPTAVGQKAGVAMLGGAGGELLGAAAGAAWRKFVTEPRYFNRATQSLTPEGEAAARAAGLDPASFVTQGTGVATGSPQAAQQFAREMARTGDPQAALRGVIDNEFRIPRTKGEVLGNTQQLLREQQMLGGAYGETAQKGMQAFRSRQEMMMERATRGVGDDLAPARAGSPMSKADVGENIRANTLGVKKVAEQFEDQAWKKVPDLTATDDMLADIPAAITNRMQNIFVTEARTPQAASMIRDVERFMAGEAPEQVSKLLPTSPTRDIDQMRRRLLDGLKAASTPEDKRAAGALYDAYNDWIVSAAIKSGDPSIAGNMIIARGLTRQIKETFQGQRGSPGARIMSDILEKSDSPEGIVNALFLNPASSEIKRGSVDALKSLKRAYETYWPKNSPEAKAAWDDIRLAYWLKVIERKTGETYGPAQLASNIKGALNNQKTVTNLLFDAGERGRMMRLAAVLDDVKKRNPNTSWSGVSIGAMMSDMGNAIASMLGANTVLGRMAIRTVSAPVREGWNAARMRAATGGGAGVQPPALPPPSYAGPAAGALTQDR